ncbi:MAG: hypothetical protein JWM14_1143 [Chitinophagaceae bacterium]|nr:hypothetical protein [Chitinophagaceae bacterium]
MKKLARLVVLLILVTFFNACEEHRTETQQTASTPVADTITVPTGSANNGDTLVSGKLKVYPLSDSPSFNDAILTLNAPAEKELLKNDKVHFAYDIKNYQLSKPTLEGSCAIDCANSGQGQHIHLILNNQPYLAKYTPEFDETLQPGHYVALSFLSRSYHESIKHYEAFDLRQFTVGKVKEKDVDLTQPMLFYSRPKGEYKGAETKKILLDFYVINATLGVNDYSVRATVDGNVFLLKSWKGYLIEGLSIGEHTIKIELLDKTGTLVKSPYALSERTIKLLPETN